jgi:hypothetical protein
MMPHTNHTKLRPRWHTLFIKSCLITFILAQFRLSHREDAKYAKKIRKGMAKREEIFRKNLCALCAFAVRFSEEVSPQRRQARQEILKTSRSSRLCGSIFLSFAIGSTTLRKTCELAGAGLQITGHLTILLSGHCRQIAASIRREILRRRNSLCAPKFYRFSCPA